MTSRTLCRLLCLSLCFAFTGCASLTKKDAGDQVMKWPWQKKEEEPYPNPVKMAVTWTPDILVQPGRTPTRGFGGRVYFYNEKSQAVPVEGDLFIHGFDELSGNQASAENTKRYQFTSEQFTKKFSKTDLGASYSIWIPWDAAGGFRKQLSLVPSFRTAEGKVVQGEAARLTLPGKKPDAQAIAKRNNQSPIRQVGHYVGNPSQHTGLTGSTKLQTTTIPLPKSFQQRLAHMGEQKRHQKVSIQQPLPAMNIHRRVAAQPQVSDGSVTK